jgi:hypothetical protein
MERVSCPNWRERIRPLYGSSVCILDGRKQLCLNRTAYRCSIVVEIFHRGLCLFLFRRHIRLIFWRCLDQWSKQFPPCLTRVLDIGLSTVGRRLKCVLDIRSFTAGRWRLDIGLYTAGRWRLDICPVSVG